MKILLLSDIHSDEDIAKYAYIAEKPDFVLDCGDHDSIKNLFDVTPHLYIHGNHEPSSLSSTSDDYSLPFKLSPGQICILRKNDEEVKVAGLDGNYSKENMFYRVNDYGVEGLAQLPANGVDVLLLHESPLNVKNANSLVEKVKEEIKRISPKFVFSGHSGMYEEKIIEDTKYVQLNAINEGYGILDFNKGRFHFRRVISKFGN